MSDEPLNKERAEVLAERVVAEMMATLSNHIPQAMAVVLIHTDEGVVARQLIPSMGLLEHAPADIIQRRDQIQIEKLATLRLLVELATSLMARSIGKPVEEVESLTAEDLAWMKKALGDPIDPSGGSTRIMWI